MVDKEDLHAGHRERMYRKLKDDPASLGEHELLEILLFALVPRKDTNALSHRLLRTFGSLDSLFSASVGEIMTVDGAGERVAGGIAAFGMLMKEAQKKKTSRPSISNFEQAKAELKDKFIGLREEKFLLLLLDRKYKKIFELSFEDHRPSEVNADIPEIANAFALHRPAFALIAHNHPSGVAKPSDEDDFSTKKLNMLCEVHGVTLIDHIIVAGDEVYSYSMDKRLMYIRDCSDISELFDRIKENK